MSEAEVQTSKASQEAEEASPKVVYNRGPRHPIATCDSCCASKVSCSRELPSCSRCVRLGVACVYPLSRRTKPNEAEDQENNTVHDIQVVKAVDMLRLQGKLSTAKVQKIL